jgi:hypothetical protein
VMICLMAQRMMAHGNKWSKSILTRHTLTKWTTSHCTLCLALFLFSISRESSNVTAFSPPSSWGSCPRTRRKHSSSKFESLLNGQQMAPPVPWRWNRWCMLPLAFHGKATLRVVSWGPKCHILNRGTLKSRSWCHVYITDDVI